MTEIDEKIQNEVLEEKLEDLNNESSDLCDNEQQNDKKIELEELINSELNKALAKQEEYLSMAQRIQADFENFKRRNSNVRSEAYDDGAREFIKSLLPVYDNLERALAQNVEDSPLFEGIKLVYAQFTEVFEKRGVKPICRLGEKFDPKIEDAVVKGTSEEGEPGTVCEVFLKGYMLGETIIRHAMVKVVAE